MKHCLPRLSSLCLVGIFIFMLATCTPGYAEDVRLSATVDKTQLTLEDTVELSITVHGERNPPAPILPSLPDFKVREEGTQSSTQIINSDITVSVTNRYRLIPTKTGTFVIGPATMTLDGRTYNSDPITLTVERPKPGGAEANAPAFVEVSVSNENPFVNEQVTYTFKLFQRVEARNINLDMPYDDTLFRKESLGKARQYAKSLNGVPYNVNELSMALFPLKPGKTILPPSVLEMDIILHDPGRRRNDPFSRFFNDPFFGNTARSEHKVLTSSQIPLSIRPLPEQGKPANFSNLTGQFNITAELGKLELEAGDTTTLSIKISGTGNVMDAVLPEPDLQDHFKVYPDQPEFKSSISGNLIGGEKVFKFALIPFSEGIQTVPSIPFSFFDPEKKAYVTLQTQPFQIKVLAGTKNEDLNLVEPRSTPHADEPSVKILARDILPIHTEIADFEDMLPGNTRYFIFTAGLLLPPALYLIGSGYVRYNRRMKYDTAYFRNQNAYNLALGKLGGLSGSQDSRTLGQEISQSLRRYVGDKLNLQGTAFTSAEIEVKLKSKGFQESRAAAVSALLEKCEAMQYAPMGGGNHQNLIDESLHLLKELERQA